jgi:flavodoxin II
MTGEIGLFYGSTTCYTEIAAEKIRDTIRDYSAGSMQVDLFNIADQPLAAANAYQCLILGIPTWDYGELEENWENIWPDIADVHWQDKTVALYGLGDQVGYPDWFQDAMGYLWIRVSSLGARCVGQWPSVGYHFTNSLALTEDRKHFVGLALDEDNDFDLSEDRIMRWCHQIMAEFDSAIRA